MHTFKYVFIILLFHITHRLPHFCPYHVNSYFNQSSQVILSYVIDFACFTASVIIRVIVTAVSLLNFTEIIQTVDNYNDPIAGDKITHSGVMCIISSMYQAESILFNYDEIQARQRKVWVTLFTLLEYVLW